MCETPLKRFKFISEKCTYILDFTFILDVTLPGFLGNDVRVAKNLGGVESLVGGNRLASWCISITHHLMFWAHFETKRQNYPSNQLLENTKLCYYFTKDDRGKPVNPPYQDVISSSEGILENRLRTVNSQTKLTPLKVEISDRNKIVKDSSLNRRIFSKEILDTLDQDR